MTTTITTSELDFETIKNNLKTHLQKQSEFADYDFEASGLSNILDVLALNTHLNAQVANFTLNESFLGTAQLRSSLVSLATGIGYIPDTKTSAQGSVRVTLDLSGVSGRPSVVELPAFTRFSATVDDVAYTFLTKDTFNASDDGNGLYVFVTDDGVEAIPIFEGVRKTKTFLVGSFSEFDTYIIPDLNMDGDTVSVDVYDTVGGTTFTPYTNIINADTIDANSTIYILKEAPNEFYQLSFGGNGILGTNPEANNVIVVNYISTNGPDANTADTFIPLDTITVGATSYNLSATDVSAAIGGDEKESIESIRRNAPFQYATQNRMVTPEDYTAIILRNYSTLIDDIKCWGGQDNPDPKFGFVYASIQFEDDVTDSVIASTKTGISSLVDQLAVVSFGIEFADPVVTYIESSIFFQVNPKLTPLSINALKNNVQTAVDAYYANAIGGFDKSFRRSNLLSVVDDVSAAILSSRADIKMQKRITPTINVNNTVVLTFPVDIGAADNDEYTVTSDQFLIDGATCRMQNKLNSTTIQIVNTSNGAIVVDSVGTFDPTNKTVSITAFKPTALLGGSTDIKISVVPANQSAISPVRNDILQFDNQISTVKPLLVGADN